MKQCETQVKHVRSNLIMWHNMSKNKQLFVLKKKLFLPFMEFFDVGGFCSSTFLHFSSIFQT